MVVFARAPEHAAAASQLLSREAESPLAAAAGPAAVTANEVVLNAADVAPNFVLASSGEKLEAGVSWRAQSLRRSGKFAAHVEPEGVFFVRSFALVAPDPAGASRIFDEVADNLFNEISEVPAPTVGERSRAGVALGEGPFSPALKIVLFRTRSVVGLVFTGAYDEPRDLNDILPLAQTMALRAAR